MVPPRSQQKVERVTVTLIREGDERQQLRVPSTFNRDDRSYSWKRAGSLEYMIVPTRVSSTEVRVDLFFAAVGGRRRESGGAIRQAEAFIRARVGSEWRGLKLGSIGRPVSVAPPRKSYVRGTIEEMLGATTYDR